MTRLRDQLAVTVEQYNVENPTEGISVRRAPVPSPGKGEALCQMVLRPVNPSDASDAS